MISKLYRTLKYNKSFVNNFISLTSLVQFNSLHTQSALRNCIKKIQVDKMVNTSTQLFALRSLMNNLPNGGKIDAYIIPTDDAHQSEYISEHDARREFICGFDGSAGTVVVTNDHALLWTDGRYYQQATMQLDNNWTLMKDALPTTPEIGDWLNKNLPNGSKIGTDPMLLSFHLWDRIKKQLEICGNELIPVEPNLVDLIWNAQLPQTNNNVINLPLTITGETIQKKVNQIREEMQENETDVLIVTALDEVAYLFNMRGSDIAYNPLFFGYSIITHDEIFLFVDKTKLRNPEIHFGENDCHVIVSPYNDIKNVLQEMIKKFNRKFWISTTSSYFLTNLIPEKKRLQKMTPIALMKAIKNEIETKGMIDSHERDGLALCQYFAWLEDMIRRGEYVDEITGAEKLEWFRSQQYDFVAISFPTINGSGPNGSVIHYHSTKETNRQITDKEIYLCDSGAHYLDGTTDVTRTMHFGTPSDYEKDCYTRVLKGQINLAMTIFPKGIKGLFLDTIARKSLWDNGLDYRHGTGHGIGHFLCVHEGPMGIGFRVRPDDSGLVENMFISNEPGYYEDGKFGIRIEDIVRIVPINIGNNFGGRGALTFETVTMCPIQTKMINTNLLTEKEKKHLNDYHQRVLNTLLPKLKADSLTTQWLIRECAPIH